MNLLAMVPATLLTCICEGIVAINLLPTDVALKTYDCIVAIDLLAMVPALLSRRRRDCIIAVDSLALVPALLPRCSNECIIVIEMQWFQHCRCYRHPSYVFRRHVLILSCRYHI